MILSMPFNFQEKLKGHYLWSLSKAGQTKLRAEDREELVFSQAMGQYPDIEVCARKSMSLLDD